MSGPNCWTIEPPVFCCVPSTIKLEAASKAVLKLSKFRFPNRFNYPSKCLCKRRNLNEPSISSSCRQTLAGRFHTDTFFYFLNLSNHFSYPTIAENDRCGHSFRSPTETSRVWMPQCGFYSVDDHSGGRSPFCRTTFMTGSLPNFEDSLRESSHYNLKW